MTPHRKRQILDAEEQFASRSRLSRALVEKGVYIVGKLTHDALARRPVVATPDKE